MKKLAMLALLMTLTFAVGLVSVNVEDVSAKVFGNNFDRAAQSGGGGSGGGNTANQGIGQ